MKIWCFLCFGEEEEINKNYLKVENSSTMSDGVSGNVTQGTAAEDMEKDETEGFGLGFTSWGIGKEEEEGPSSEMGGMKCDVVGNEGVVNNDEIGNWDEAEVNLKNVQHFDQLGSTTSQGILDLNLRLGLSDEPSSSSSSLIPVGLDREACDHDLQNKRPKVHSLSLYSRFEVHSYISQMYEDGGPDNLRASGGTVNNKGNDNMTSTVEDFEVRMDITDDLLHVVFSFLDHIDLCQASKVCRQWRAASSHEDFWRYLNFENRQITLQQFEDMCLRYPNATAVNIYNTPNLHLLVMKAISALRNLEVLTLGNGQIAETTFQALTDCLMLRSLTIIDATLGNGIQGIRISHVRLRLLQVMECRVLRVYIRCPRLETLSLKRSSMPHVVLNCPLLKDLDIASCHKLSDAAIRSAATSCPLLEALDMSNCSGVSDATLSAIALACANLHILDASYCPNISLESVGFPMLTVLKLHSCEGITSASMDAVAHSYNLEVLELDNCILLTSVSLDLPRLKNIRFVHCRKFMELDLQSSMLSSITVSNCPSLRSISITSSTLKKLVLQKQESLTKLALQCQSLQEVDLTECGSLTDSICEVFSDGRGCPVLKSLVLDNCKSLTAVSLCSSSLISLSFAGCCAVTTLELKCPYLEQVSLDGCDILERASFCPVGLRSLNLGICPKLNVLDIEAPQMASLELKGCGVLSEASINCPLLASLDASFCSQLKDGWLSATAASCTLIESLVLMLCQSVGPVELFSLCRLPNLTYLDLSYTSLLNLQPVYGSCVHLKVLKLQACKDLADSSLEPLYKGGALPALCELDLSSGTLCQSDIEDLLACCTQLTHVSLNGCVNMHDLDWGFSDNQILGMAYGHAQPNRLLQNLTCVGCPNIKKVVIPPTAQCSHLSSLNLSLSANLKEVDIACPNLGILNLSNCYSLEILRLKCPRLTSLFLQSCNINEEVVEAAITTCGMLETLDVRFCPKILPVSMARLRAACPSLKRIFSSLAPS